MNEEVLKDNTHPETIRDFVDKLEKKYHKVTSAKNNLPIMENGRPTQKGSIYRPDILVFDKNENITHILEIETGDGGKSMVGAIFLADASINKHIEQKIQDSKIKPDLIFIILGNKYNAIKRIEAVKPYLNLKHITTHIYTKNEAYKELFNPYIQNI
ncbi:MAG: hypothetical protein KKA35_16795 [Proteobacteria bacterium]|nr:hypothetical protein [Pseudomonadota bacterium]